MLNSLTRQSFLLVLLSLARAAQADTSDDKPLSRLLQTPSPSQETAQGTLRPMEVQLNRTPMGSWTLLEYQGSLYATPEALKEWRLLRPLGLPAIHYRGQTWLPLFGLPGYRAQFDFSTQSMSLEFGADAFVSTRLANERPAPPSLSPTLPAVFLNYDLTHTESAASGANRVRDTGALTELGVSVAEGTLISSQLMRHPGQADLGASTTWRRLETTWTQDFQQHHLTLRLGDSSTRASMWGRPLYFGGVQFGTNFGLTPGFLSQPIPTLSGSATGPSTMELYINNALRQTANIPAGPFTIENFTPFTGAGDARVVVRDVLGRETVVTRSFFSSNQMLEKGLQDWSVSVGRERFNLGVQQSDYRDGFASGLYRQGVTQGLTLEGRLDASRSLQAAGLGLNSSLPWAALGQAALAVSREESGGQGAKLLLGWDQQQMQTGFSARSVWAQRAYRELGFMPGELPYQRELAVNYRHSWNGTASMSLGAASLQTYDNGVNNLLTASYSVRVAERGSLIFSGTRVTGNSFGYTVGVSLVLPLDGRQTVTASVTSTRNGSEAYAAVSTPVTTEVGLGWRALAGHRNSENYAEGSVYFQGNKGYVGADLSASGSTQTLRLNAQGAAVVMDGHAFAARRIQDSFALVEVRGYPGVGVGFQGAPLTHTDEDGLALLPRLAAYQTNHVRLNANDLPFSAELDSIEQSVVPAWRRGVKVDFPVRSGRGALLRWVLEDGESVPVGATVVLRGDDKTFFVGRRGEAYVTGLQSRNSLTLTWKGQSCIAEVELPSSPADDIMRLGPIRCTGVER